ncbi:MAG: [protein-PII] uridylyltransferase [Ketobacter sp.]|nr:[protein-PII] uridylyltransferase [Ketobacter sp.]
MKTPLVTELKHDPELFEEERFERLVAEKGSVALAFKQAIRDADEILNQRFLRLENIKLIIRRRAWVMDNLLQRLWSHYSCAQCPDIALLAVGGYGRAELHPHSDIDLMILLRDDASAERSKEDLSAFVTQLWDIGLDVGHSVRTLKQCAELADSDITIATNLMESRTICGDPSLTEEMQKVTGPEHIWDAKAFFMAKWTEQIARYDKFSNTEFNLEPDIKGAPGGLRDIQNIGWVAKRYFNANRMSELVSHGFLTSDEYDILNSGHLFLWEVRYALHLITGRGENRLLFDHQRAVADMLGYRDSKATLAVEKFMKRYYRVALSISQLNDMLLQHFDEAILRADEPEVITPVNSRFQIRNDFIEVTHDKVFERTPSALLEVFLILAQNENIQAIRASTIRLIRDSRHLVDEHFRNDIRNISLFMELLRSPNKIYTQFHRMKRYGILGNYIPAFGQAIGQMQYDLFHIYTVDAHSLHVLRNLRMFRHPEVKKDFPIAHFLVQRIPKIELLYIAGLFHDLGKGRGGDHSKLGAVDAYNFCIHHRLSKWDASLVAWLVENHLLMSITSQKKDVSDPDVIHEFACKVSDQIRLDYLHALTVADICATNPKLWNGWRGALLRQLYAETRRALRRGLENPGNREDWIEETKERAMALLSNHNFKEADVTALWDYLGDDYFLRETYGDVARHTEAILNHADSDEPLVLLGKTDERNYQGAAEVFIYTQDAPNLFAATVAALNQLNLSIADAKIITSSTGFSLDTYIILEENGSHIGDDPARVQQIQTKLRKALKDPSKYPEIVHKRMPRALKHFNIPTEVIISNDIEKEYTILELVALDRPGLLAEVGCIFLENNMLIQNARIATLGERVEDVFYITDHNGDMIKDPALCEQLKSAFKEKLDQTAT